MTKHAPPPPVAPETWRELFTAAATFAAPKPWEALYDSDVVGLVDPVTGETRIGCVLGNAGEVFGAVMYRRAAGQRWILSMLEAPPEAPELTDVDGIDCLKLELVPKRELRPEDHAAIAAAGFKPAGRGHVWPQFRAALPGRHPWFIDPNDARQFLADLPRLTAFCALWSAHPDLAEDRALHEIPFLPEPMPGRPLTPADLDWRPIVIPPSSDLLAYQAPADDLDRLRALPVAAEAIFEFESRIQPGGSFLEDGRPCFGRVSLLVEAQDGLMVGVDAASGTMPAGEAAGRALVKALLAGQVLPGKLFIRGQRLQPVLAPVCAQLGIQLCPVNELPALAEAEASLLQFMAAQ